MNNIMIKNIKNYTCITRVYICVCVYIHTHIHTIIIRMMYNLYSFWLFLAITDFPNLIIRTVRLTYKKI